MLLLTFLLSGGMPAIILDEYLVLTRNQGKPLQTGFHVFPICRTSVQSAS
jgi:hypothetical protein